MSEIYTYDEALESSKKYFGGEEFPAKCFVDKYALRDDEGNFLENNPDQMHRRLAKEFARIEAKKFKKPLSEDEIYNLFYRYAQIIPQGSPIFAIGNPYQFVSSSNCFVIDSPEDSYAGILHADQQLVQISKRRGGVGLDLSTLRPTGDKVLNASRTSTGIKSWMSRYSNSTREVGQGGRRGALMLTCSVHHPDIETFITAKNNGEDVTGANISVRLTDEFLNAIESKIEYELRFPVNNGRVYSKKDAKEIWNKIVHNAWNRAEPGILFWDNIIRESLPDCYSRFGYNSISTNPCLSKNSPIISQDGLTTLEKVDVGSYIWSESGWTKVIKKWSTGMKSVYKYKTTAGFFLGTENHKIVQNGKKIEVKNAETIDIIKGPDYKNNAKLIPLNQNLLYIMDGLVIGDGSVHEASNNLVFLCIGENDQEYFTSEIKTRILKHRPGIKQEAYEVETSIKAEELPLTYNRFVPDRFKFGTPDTVCSFLRGLYSANGSVCDNRITLKSASKQIIEDVQLMLSSIGISSYYTTNKSKEVEFSNGTYNCKESYDLNITTDREIFVRHIGFIQDYKNEKIKIIKSKQHKYSYEIIEKEYIGEEEVFDITVDNESHTYWTGGCNVSNCGEIILCADDSCRLMAINLFSCVVNPFTSKAYYDTNKLYHLAQTAQRLMDDMIDLELECIDRIISKIKSDKTSKNINNTELELWINIRKKCENGRRTGLGITVLGDTLAALGIKYGTEGSIHMTEQIYQVLKFGSYRSSCDMAKELGAFPIWDWELEKDNPFLNRIKNEKINIAYWEDSVIEKTIFNMCSYVIDGKELFDDIKQYGRRNIANLTTAPTGTISSQAGMLVLEEWYHNTSSGIEPVYEIDIVRSKKGNPGDLNFRSDFVDNNGDHWMKFNIYHSGLKAWMAVTGETDITNSPYWGATAPKINWVNRVKLQAAAQRHVDHSISSTVNLPEDVTEEEVAKIYMEAWKSGLKGITVYRDNCRTGVLVDNNKAKKADSDRPKELPCDVHHVSVKGKSYFVLVGILNDKPYEVFAGKNGFINKDVKTGLISKMRGKGKYKVVFDDEEELAPITAACDEHEETITRLTSGLLRSSSDINMIVTQLEKVNGDMTSFAKGIARCLKKYIKNGTKVKGEICPECKATEIVRQDGCKKCLSCGFSQCS